MRIIGGRYKGARISAPKGMATRPTSDRTRESLFNILANHIDLTGIRVLDLFAGSGALGLEAVSRGAAFALFVDDSSAARAAIRQNVEALGVTGNTKLYRRDATRLGEPGTLVPFDVIFADPPYGKGLAEKAATVLHVGKWMNQSALFVLEEAKATYPEILDGFRLIDRRDYGETTIGLFECHHE